jgi:hypothetical protein
VKFRIIGTIDNFDVQAHAMIVEVHGFNHVGAVLPTDTFHRLPLCVVKDLRTHEQDYLPAYVRRDVQFEFEMDEVTMVRLAPNRLSDGLTFRYHVELVEDPAAPPAPLSAEEATP